MRKSPRFEQTELNHLEGEVSYILMIVILLQDIEVLHSNTLLVLANEKLKKVFEVHEHVYRHVHLHIQVHRTYTCLSTCTCAIM